MEAHGISFHSGSVSKHLRTNNYVAILFEFFSSAVHNVNTVRTLQPDATLVVDSVDLTYKRWIAMADLTGLQADRIKAIQIERQELGVYALSDLVLTLTDDESNEL